MAVLDAIVQVFAGILGLLALCAWLLLIWKLIRKWAVEEAAEQAKLDEWDAKCAEELPLLRKILDAPASDYEGMSLSEAMEKEKKEASDG